MLGHQSAISYYPLFSGDKKASQKLQSAMSDVIDSGVSILRPLLSQINTQQLHG